MDDSPSARITEELLTWPGVTAGPHRFGGVEFHLGETIGQAERPVQPNGFGDDGEELVSR